MDKLCQSIRSEPRKLYASVDCHKHFQSKLTASAESGTASPKNTGISPTPARIISPVAKTRLATLAQIGEDWLYLALLGIIMALLSFSMDSVITLFLNTRLWMFKDLSEDNMFVQYLGWCLMPIILVISSSGFVQLCSPTAIGSGIPEMKTILRGVVLNEYLTFRTLIAKIVGLTFTLGSGLPLGKEGPFVHMASIVATLLSKLVASFQGIYENESRTSEMLSAACAVGVAATFYAPIGGVLFSIEVTTVYFAVRNYWRGFFAACCGATIWRLLGFWIKNDESITALFKTNFRNDFPFDPIELLMFSFIGATSGLAGAGYIKFHREIVQFFRSHKRLSAFFQKNRFVYPILVTLIITTVNFPPLFGKYTASTLSTHTTIEHLFSNRTWSLGYQDLESKHILDEWSTPDTSFYLHLVLYIIMLFWTSALASTIPIPSGMFIPVLKIGAAYGRLVGELMHSAFPNGIKYGNYIHPASIVPGSYAVVGAAAFSGAVTHTISTSVILFEMTGQIVHIIPVILGVLIANAVCQSLQPSIYDSIIEIKKLPYLPPIASSNSVSHKILVKDFMNTNLAFVWKEKCTYADLKSLLTAHKKIISFPLVESPSTMKLLGSVPRHDLLKILYLHLGRERRFQEVSRRNSEVRCPAIISIDGGGLCVASVGGEKCGDLMASEDRGLEFSTSCASNEKANSRSSRDSSFSAGSIQKSTGISDGLVLNILREVSSPQTSPQLPKSASASATSNGAELQVGGPSVVSKLINHYDRGSSMDEQHLDACQKEAEDLGLADIVENLGSQQVASSGVDEMNSNGSIEPIKIGQNFRNESATELKDPIFHSKVPSASKLNNDIRPWSPYNQEHANEHTIQRPRSILKTSNTLANFSNMYKRNISSQSFAGQLPVTGDHKTLSTVQSSHIIGTAQRGSRQHSLVMCGEEPGSSTNNNSLLELAPVPKRRKVRLPRLRVVDMTQEEQEQWEREQLTANIDISRCQVDEAPFQLVEQTSLYRVHTLFSMLGLNHAYVTSFGRLVGVVALKDMRFAIEKMLQEK